MVLTYIKDNPGAPGIGFWAEQVIDVLGWDKSVRYPQRRYRLAAYNFMSNLERKGIVKRIYDFQTQKHLGYKLL